MTIVNLSNNSVATQITGLANLPFSVCVDPDGSRVYIGLYGGNTIDIINTANNSYAGSISVGRMDNGIAFSPDCKRAYVSNWQDGTISVIDVANNTVIDTIQLDVSLPLGIEVTPDGSKVYVACESGWVKVISTANDTAIATISVHESPGNQYAYGLAITPDGTKVYVSNYANNNVSVISTSSNTVIASVSIPGSNPTGVAITPDGKNVYVASHALNKVYRIDTSNNSVSSAFNTGSVPIGISITNDGTKVITSNGGDGTATIASIPDHTVLASPTVRSNQYAFGKMTQRYASPTSNFTAIPLSVPIPVQFNDTSTEYPTSWSWDFGDGSNNSTQNPVHTYNNTGNCTVALTVSNAAGGSNTTTKKYHLVLQLIPEDY